jgi:hypothetical protein
VVCICLAGIESTANLTKKVKKMINASYHLVTPADPNALCRFCSQPFGNRPVVFHDGGEDHPVHRRCIQALARTFRNPACPHCHVHIDQDSLYTPQSLKEKTASCVVHAGSYSP